MIQAHDSGHVLQLVMRRDLDAILLPDDAAPVDGEELLPLVRRLTRAAILVVGQGEETKRAQTLLQGADVYLPYPVDRQELRSRLRALMRRQDSGRRPGRRRGGRREDEDTPLFFRLIPLPLPA